MTFRAKISAVLGKFFGQNGEGEEPVQMEIESGVTTPSKPDYYYDILHVNDICGGYTSVDIYDNATREHLVRGTVPMDTSPFEHMKTMLKDLPCYQEGKTYKDLDTIFTGDD